METTITEMDLARLVFGADEMKCESSHGGDIECSVIVTHRILWCRSVTLVCENATKLHRRAPICRGCGKSIEDCWTIRPI